MKRLIPADLEPTGMQIVDWSLSFPPLSTTNSPLLLESQWHFVEVAPSNLEISHPSLARGGWPKDSISQEAVGHKIDRERCLPFLISKIVLLESEDWKSNTLLSIEIEIFIPLILGPWYRL
ncbi:hypothetical protein DM860_017382 [Cuscuta australis]|uniref:Uncharacterized protein n=1 Tax=Cuscuta australis TaxID=267555 RepID=A0A328DQN2_9ASTE|nr:hypothetical protein DM860_017382 [Cuscuta australis]